MREQRDEQGVVYEGVCRLELAVVNVDDVGDLLERVEGDPRRQYDSQHRRCNAESKRIEQRGKRVREEVEVLEETEKRQVDADRQYE